MRTMLPKIVLLLGACLGYAGCKPVPAPSPTQGQLPSTTKPDPLAFTGNPYNFYHLTRKPASGYHATALRKRVERSGAQWLDPTGDDSHPRARQACLAKAGTIEVWMHGQSLFTEKLDVFAGEVFVFDGSRLLGRIPLTFEHTFFPPRVMVDCDRIFLEAYTGDYKAPDFGVWMVEKGRCAETYRVAVPAGSFLERRHLLLIPNGGGVDRGVYEVQEASPWRAEQDGYRAACRLVAQFDETAGRFRSVTRPTTGP